MDGGIGKDKRGRSEEEGRKEKGDGGEGGRRMGDAAGRVSSSGRKGRALRALLALEVFCIDD